MEEAGRHTSFSVTERSPLEVNIAITGIPCVALALRATYGRWSEALCLKPSLLTWGSRTWPGLQEAKEGLYGALRLPYYTECLLGYRQEGPEVLLQWYMLNLVTSCALKLLHSTDSLFFEQQQWGAQNSSF